MKTVAVCETQPMTVEGIRAVLSQCEDIEFAGAAGSLAEAAAMLRVNPPDILLLDKAFGGHTLSSWIMRWHDSLPHTSLIVWGHSISEPEALRMLQTGVRGVLRKNATPDIVTACFRAVASGGSWVEETLFRETFETDGRHRSDLTNREKQVLELVENGLKNKEIARELGIRPGTVKIHLKHIFEKTGVRGRYGLALTGMRDRGLLSAPRPDASPADELCA